MHHIFCPYSRPRPLGGVKRSFFTEVVMLHIKLKGIERRAPCKKIFSHCTRPQPLGYVQKVKHSFFLKVVMLHIKLKGTEHRAQCKHIFCPYTHPQLLGVWSKGQNISFSENSHAAYQIKGDRTQNTMEAHILFLHTPKAPRGMVKRSKHFFF